MLDFVNLRFGLHGLPNPLCFLGLGNDAKLNQFLAPYPSCTSHADSVVRLNGVVSAHSPGFTSKYLI